MNELELGKFYCSAELVGHLDGCDDGAYVITKEEMKQVLTSITKQRDELLELNREFAEFAKRQGWQHVLIDEFYQLKDQNNDK